VECVVVAVDTALAAHTSPKATATPGGDAVRAPAEEVHDTTNTEGPLEAMPTKGRTQPSLRQRCLLSALRCAKLLPNMWEPARLILCPPPPKLRSEGPYTGVQ
jgi:hypothetical protein